MFLISITWRIGLFILLITSLYWLFHFKRPLSPSMKQNTPIVDEFMLGVTAKRFSPDGRQTQQLTMKKWHHYRGESINHMQAPKVTSFSPNQSYWQLTAPTGTGYQTHVGGNIKKVVFHDNVLVRRYLTKSIPDWQLQTTQLTLHLKTEIAETNKKVRVQGPNITINAKGLLAKLQSGQVNFSKQVKSHYVVPNKN